MEIQGSNFILRKISSSDRDQVAALANNRKIWLNVRDIFPYPYSIDDADFYINLLLEEERQYTLAIECENAFAGVVGIVPMQGIYRLTAEIGYWLGEPFWGKGIMTEAVRLLTDYVFHYYKFIRIHCGVFSHNEGSMKVLEKAGYHKETIFKNAIIKNGDIINEHRYCKLKEF